MSPADRLRQLLAQPDVMVTPGCFDALSAKLIERAGFGATFMGGFAVSAARLGMPDTGLISYAEMVDQGRNICGAVSIPVIGDGDTGYGNAINVQRTVRGYAQAGFACIMIEDQVSPKRCGHTRGKQTVGRDEAFQRVRAAVDARDAGADILIMARTDANATDGFDEALRRVKTFAEMGADITFLEAPRTEDEMRAYCDGVTGPKMANMVEQGDTPLLAPERLGAIGYKIVLYPITLLLGGIKAMEDALAALKQGAHPDALAEFAHAREVIGFPAYDEEEKKYATT
ncbi:MAG: isocitrate lyase/PEP mutase family protein [Proteobacteria bacterium]|nr:isocitrate lyase/PEP mutase family protein [Pseudomonadota bacterium]